MANPNPDVWGAPETWISEGNIIATEGTGYDLLKATRPRIANFITLATGSNAGKTPINQSLDATICPCGQDSAISPFAKIRMFKNHKDAATNKIPEQTIITENDVCNWFLFDGNGGYFYGWNTDHYNESGAGFRWLPNATLTNNLNASINPYVFWQLKSLLVAVTVLSISSYSSGVPNYAEITLEQWKTTYSSRKIADIRLSFIGVQSAASSGISYYNTSATNSGHWAGVGYIGKLYSEIEHYAAFVRNGNFSFDVIGHIVGNYYASSSMFTMNSADMFDNVELKSAVINYDTGRGWSVWNEIPYSDANYNKVLSIASLFGCPFTPTTKRNFDIAFTDDDLYLPIVDNMGIAHGEYTHGTRNVDNPLYTVDSVRDMGYDPYRVYYGTYCKVCGYGGEVKSICPRCHATGSSLVNIFAMTQGPIWKLDVDDPTYGSLYELDMQRDQESGFTNPNLHRRAELQVEGSYEELWYPNSNDVLLRDFEVGTIEDVKTITKYKGAETYVKIPDTFVGAGYTTLGKGLFTDTDVVYVEIPEGITTIE